jgi:hypothetical protein
MVLEFPAYLLETYFTNNGTRTWSLYWDASMQPKSASQLARASSRSLISLPPAGSADGHREGLNLSSRGSKALIEQTNKVMETIPYWDDV